MHQTLVEAGRERMRALGGHGALGRHAGMPDRVCAGHCGQSIAVGDILGQPDPLVHLHAPAGSDHTRAGGDGREERAYRAFLAGRHTQTS